MKFFRIDGVGISIYHRLVALDEGRLAAHRTTIYNHKREMDYYLALGETYIMESDKQATVRVELIEDGSIEWHVFSSEGGKPDGVILSFDVAPQEIKEKVCLLRVLSDGQYEFDIGNRIRENLYYVQVSLKAVHELFKITGEEK